MNSTQYLVTFIRKILRRYLVLFFTILTYIFLSFFIILLGFLWVNPNKLVRSDYASYLAGGLMVREGRGMNLYDIDTQMLYQDKVMQPYTRQIFFPFRYLPFVALPFVSLTNFSLLHGYALYAAFNIIVLALFWFMCAKLFRNIYRFWLWPLVPFAFMPNIASIVHGQTSTTLSLVLLFVYYLLNKGKEVGAGALFGLLLIKPHFFIFGLPFFLILAKRKSHFLLGNFLTCLSLFLVSIRISGLDALMAYPSFLLATENIQFGTNTLSLSSLYSLFSFLSIGILSQFQLLLFNTVLWTVAVLIFMRRHLLIEFDFAFVVATAFMLVFAIHTQPQDLSMLLLPILILFHALVAGKGKALLFPLALAITVSIVHIFFIRPLILLAIGLYIVYMPSHNRA